MCQGQQPSSQQSGSSKDEPSASGKESSRTKSDNWFEVKDPSERRKIQNKLAQRRYSKYFIFECCSRSASNKDTGDKVKEQREESERDAENRQHAGSSYASPEPESLNSSQNLSGLPWGGISMKHIVGTGKSKEQSSQQSSRENSVQGSASHTGG